MKKFSQLTPKAKKITVISSAAAVCICALSVIIYQANNSGLQVKAADTTSAVSSETSAEAPVSVAPITGTATVSMPSGIAGTGSAWVPSSGKSVSAPLTITQKPASAPSKPVITGDSKDGKQPANSALMDKTKKPTYTTPPKSPTAPASKTPTNNGGSTQKSGGSGNDPFNHATVETGGNQQTTVGNSGDTLTGDKVGIMD